MHQPKINVISDEEFKEIVEKSRSISEVARFLGFKHKPGYESKCKIKNRITLLGLSLSSEKIIRNQNPNRLKIIRRNLLHCANCTKELNRRHNVSSENDFCDRECANEFKSRTIINNWKNGSDKGYTGSGRHTSVKQAIRRYLLAKNNYSCQKCGFNIPHPIDNVTILEIHHTDGNALNNVEENLEVLCPNCHALTDTYRGRNLNSARTNTSD